MHNTGGIIIICVAIKKREVFYVLLVRVFAAVMGCPEFNPEYWYLAFFSDGFKIYYGGGIDRGLIDCKPSNLLKLQIRPLSRNPRSEVTLKGHKQK